VTIQYLAAQPQTEVDVAEGDPKVSKRPISSKTRGEPSYTRP
jgi:hypothetical protein